MHRITTILGDITPRDLGLTSFHEHILADMCPMENPEIPSALLKICPENMAVLRGGLSVMSKDCCISDDLDFAVRELLAFRNCVGGRTICEASPVGMRGNIEKLCEASRKSGVNLVCSTGLYLQNRHPEVYASYTVEQLMEVFLKEIDDGMDGTGSRPGFVKCAVGTLNARKNGLYERELISLKACALAAVKRDYALQIHTAAPMSSEMVLDVVELILDCGLKPDKLVMLHMDSWLRPMGELLKYVSGEVNKRSISTELPLAILQKGCNVGLDSWGSPFENVLPDDYDRAKALVELLRAGYEDHIVLGHDVINKSFGRSWGYYGFTRFAEFIPMTLGQLGYTQEIFDKLMRKNPARILAHE